MTLYTDKPVVVELRQWTGSNFSEIQGFCVGATLTNNGDGTIAVGGGGILTIQLSDYVDDLCNIYPAAFIANAKQTVSGTGLVYLFASDVVRQEKTIAIPALTLLAPNASIPVVWDTAMPSANYAVNVAPQTSGGTIGSFTTSVIAGSQTAAGVTIGVHAVAAIALNSVTAIVTAF